jgi:hypothetical protein
MPQRYIAIDPTGEGFFQVIDIAQRTGPFKKKIQDDTGTQVEVDTWGGQTFTVASFSKYLTKCGIQAEAEANTLAMKLNGAGAPTVLKRPRFVTGPVEYNVADSIREETLATFREPHCPNAKAECDNLVARLNALG